MRFLDAAGIMKREKRNNPEKAMPRKERKAERKKQPPGRRDAAAKAAASREGRSRQQPPPKRRPSTGGERLLSRDRPHLRRPDRRRAWRARRGAAVVVHRRSAGGRGLRPARDRGRPRRFEIESLRPAKDHLVVRLKGVGDRDAAEALTQHRALRGARPPAAD